MKRIHIGTLLSMCLLAAGCGGGHSASSTTTTSQQPTTVQFVSPTTNPTLDAGQTITITANQAVLWSLQSALPGSNGALSNTSTPSTSVTYDAPMGIFGSEEVTVVATSATDSTQSAALGVVVNQLPVIGGGTLSSNSSCSYDPINHVGSSNGFTGVAYATNGSPPRVIGGTGPYTWSLSSTSGALPVGLTLAFGPTTQPPSPSSVYIYGTPLSSGCSQIQVQVTDANGGIATSPVYYIVITPPPLKIQVPNFTDAYTGTPYPPVAFSVSGGVPPYSSWSVFDPVDNPLPLGMNLTPVAQNSAAAYVSGTPNGSDSQVNGGPYTPTLQVVDSEVPYPAYGSAELTFYQWSEQNTSPCTPSQNANGPNSITTNLGEMNGSYAFLLRGFDANGPVVLAGSFTADGAGNVSGGVEDAMRTMGSQTGVAITGGSYSVIQQNNAAGANTFEQGGCVVLNTSGGSNTFAISLGGCSTSVDPTTGACVNAQGVAAGLYTTGRIIEFDDNTGAGTRASGILRLQNNSAFSGGLSGTYAFGLSGFDSAHSRYAAAGSLSASSGTLNSVAADINDGGNVQSSLTGGSGSVTVGSNGRATGTLSVGTASLNLAFYIVSAQEVILASTGTPSSTNPFLSGEAISAAGPFSASSVQNSHMFHVAGLAAASGPDPNIGILSFDGIGSFSGTQYEDQAGTLSTTSLSGAYTVDSSSGRLALYPPNQGNPFEHPLVGYVVPVASTLTRQNCVTLASCVTGFLLSTDATAQAGMMEFQTPTIAPPPPFSNLYFSGYYFFGTDESLDDSTTVFAGVSAANPNGNHYAGIESASYPNSTYCQQPSCALLIPNETINSSGSYSVNSDGSGNVGGETVSITNGNITYYIDESPLNTHPSIVVIEQ